MRICAKTSLLAGALILAACSSVCYGQEDHIVGIAKTLGATAVIEPYMLVTILTVESGRVEPDLLATSRPAYTQSGAQPQSSIEFEALEKPGIIEPDKHIQIIVSSNCTSWSVDCSSDGLVSLDDMIPPERLFLRSYYTDPGADEGAGPGYESLVAPKMVATGSASEELSYEVFLKLDVTWEDEPGSYDGILKFTVMPTP